MVHWIPDAFWTCGIGPWIPDFGSGIPELDPGRRRGRGLPLDTPLDPVGQFPSGLGVKNPIFGSPFDHGVDF